MNSATRAGSLRTIVAGVGARGRDWVREIRASGQFSLAAIVDGDPSALDRVGRDTGLAAEHRFDTLSAALDRVKCDLVVVATPADDHVAPCTAALSHGRAVVVEKPFTMNVADAVSLVRLAERMRVPLIVAQNYRYMRAFRTARQLVAEGRLGTPISLAWHYYRVPHAMAQSLARLDHAALWGVGVHHLDALRHVLGRRVTGIMAESYTAMPGGGPSGASLRALLWFEGGTRATYTASYESSGHEYFEGGQEFYGRITGDRATLHILHRWLVLCERNRWPRLVRRGPRRETEERVLLRQVERALWHGEEPDASGRDNLETVAVLAAALRSFEQRCTVDPRELLSAPD